MLMSVRDMDVLRLLCWCQNVRPDGLSSISTETERENLITLGLIKRHQRSDTLLLTNSGRAFLQAALEGDVPNLTLSYHDAAIERRVRLSALMMTAYHAGINVFTILTNFCLEEYLNIGYMEGISDVFNSIRGFNMSVQVAVQSLSQWQEKYPGKEWENQLGSFDMTLYMGCNDMTSAEYFAKKCGKVTISVTNNQFPLAPLFSPIYSTTRPYSQTRSNTQRDLLQPDEFLRLNKFLCIVMFNHYKPAQLYKIMLEELPEYKKLKKCSVFDYVPEWKKREEGAKRRTAGNRTSAAPPAPQPSPASGKRPDMQPQTSPTEEAAASGSSCGNDNMTPEEIGLVEMTCEAILEGDDPELEELDDPTRIPPGRGI